MAPVSGGLGSNTFQVIATSSDGTTTSTTGDFTVTVVEQSTDSSGPTTEEVIERSLEKMMFVESNLGKEMEPQDLFQVKREAVASVAELKHEF